MAGIFETVEMSIKGALRIGETARVLTGAGFDWLIGKSKPGPRMLRETFERLGATYIKLGQFIASSPSLFPADYVEEFQLCLDRTEALPFSTIEKVLRAELGDPSRFFSHIDPVPLASASIAQVHAATLKNGEEVVIKVQKPGVSDVILTDMNFLYVAGKVLEWIAPGLNRTSLSDIISDTQTTMMEECDFLLEARHLGEFGDFLAEQSLAGVTVPRVFPEATTLCVLTMERLYGVPLTDLETVRRYSPRPEATLLLALNTWFASLLYCPFFHADLHAGNLLVLRDGRIGFIDFGIVGRISKGTWQAMTDFMDSFGSGDFVRMADALIRMGAADREVDKQAFARDLRVVFSGMEKIDPTTIGSVDANEKEINRLLIHIAETGSRNGVRFPREFALLFKQFLYFDRYIRALAPELDLFRNPAIRRFPEMQ